jgi:hypothetical protein
MPTYTFYVRKMEKTRQVLPEVQVTVQAKSELSGRIRAARQYAAQQEITSFDTGIVTESMGQRQAKVNASGQETAQ